MGLSLFYYKSIRGNVGDDFNLWIWPRLFGELNHYSDVTLVGVGSILDERLNKIKGEKIIFGSGIRSFLIDKNKLEMANIAFVRGPISSKALDGVNFITDSAYCLKLTDFIISDVKKYDAAYVPYFEHIDHFDWSLFEKITGFKVILPTLGVEAFLTEIGASRKVYSSAMHGAIFADILRVPWCRVKAEAHGEEDHLTSELKWADWSLSLDINYEPVHIGLNLNGGRRPMLTQIIKALLIRKRLIRNKKFSLSNETVVERKINQLKIEVEKFKLKFLRPL